MSRSGPEVPYESLPEEAKDDWAEMDDPEEWEHRGVDPIGPKFYPDDGLGYAFKLQPTWRCEFQSGDVIVWVLRQSEWLVVGEDL